MGQCYNSIVINAPVEKVWDTLKNFHDLSWAPDVFSKVDKRGNKGATEVGAQRTLDDAIFETLTEFDEENRSYRYRIDDGPGPLASGLVESYVGLVDVFPVTTTGQTFVLWRSQYTTKDDNSVSEFCDPVYKALLAALAKHFS